MLYFFLIIKIIFYINLFLFFISLLFLKYWFKDNNDTFSSNYNIFNIIYDIKNNKENDNLIFLYKNKKYFLFIFIFFIFLIFFRYFLIFLSFFYSLFLLKKLNNIFKKKNYIFQLNKKYFIKKQNPNLFEFLYIILIQIPITSSFYKIYVFIFLFKNKNKFKLDYKKIFEISLQRLTIKLLGGPIWLFFISINIFKIFHEKNWDKNMSLSIISLNIYENYNLYFEDVINLKIYKIFDFLILNPNTKFYLKNKIYNDFIYCIYNELNIKYRWASYITYDKYQNEKFHYCLVNINDLTSEYKNIIVFSRFLDLNNFYEDIIFNIYNEKLEKKNLNQFINTNNIIDKKNLIIVDNENLVSINCNLINQDKINKLAITINILSNFYSQKYFINNFKYNLINKEDLENYNYNYLEKIIKKKFNELKNFNKENLLDLSSEEFLNKKNIIKFKNSFLDDVD